MSINPLPNPQTPNAVGAHNTSTYPALNGKVKEVTNWSVDLTNWLQNTTLSPMVRTINTLTKNNPGANVFTAVGSSPYGLHAATGSDDQYLVKNTMGAPLVVTASGSTIDGQSSFTISVGGAATFYDYGSGTWAVTAAYTVGAVTFILAKSSPYALPAATGSKNQYIVKNGSGHPLTVNGTIDGGPSLIIPVLGAVTFFDYGSGEWAAV